MVAKRIIPCLDVKAGKTVKGVQFQTLRDVGDPVELATRYVSEGADELVFLDISASEQGRSTMVELVRSVAEVLTIPFTVGGGISSLADVSRLLEAGADKVTINSAAVKRPALIEELAKEFGAQCVVVAIDSRRISSGDTVFTCGGNMQTNRRTLEWAREVCARGAGEILLTSMDHDGTRSGYACDLTRQVSSAVSVPVIASGGAGAREHFLEVLQTGAADAALAAGLFHDQVLQIERLKQFLSTNGLEVRI